MNSDLGRSVLTVKISAPKHLHMVYFLFPLTLPLPSLPNKNDTPVLFEMLVEQYLI